jgi:DNA-binding NarL/FixJ family response regulator
MVVDDHAEVRRAMESLLESTSDLVLAGSAMSGEEAVDMAAVLQPDVVLMDLHMPGIDGVEATRRVRAQRCPPVVVALSGSRTLMREAVAAGAAGALLKDEDPERLLDVIRILART